MVSAVSPLKYIPVARPYFDNNEKALVLRVMRSGWIAQGKMVEEFEKRVAKYTGAKYAVATSSGTTALHLALIVSGIGAGDEVIVPSFSFIATANSVRYCAAAPIFADIDPRTYNIDPKSVEKSIKDSKKTAGRIKAIMPVHQFGLPCDMDAISNIAKRHGLTIVEDAACAFGSLYKGKKIGGGNNIACFSFHPRKILTTGEGGMIVTNNAAYAKKARILRNHGLERAGDYAMLGYNYRMTDLQAAIGIGQMSKFTKILNKRVLIAERYNKLFKNIKNLQIPHRPPFVEPNYQSYVIRIVDRPDLRDKIINGLFKNGIHARRGNTAIHMQPLYRKRYTRLPNTEAAAHDTVALPIYFGMTRDEQDLVITLVKDLLCI